ncbi:MAG: InlB B-repeat-containing protein [Lachnospiraceae bacterium]|nr:InlB B-repeat-containing protein [Lachnospiraceae bacterium]
MKGFLKKLLILTAAAVIVATAGIKVDASAKTMHNVTFIYGTKVITVPVAHGKNAPVPTDTAVPGYLFLSWVGSAANVTEDRVILGAYAKAGALPAIPSVPAIGVPTNLTPPPTNVALWTKKFTNNKSAQFPAWWATLNIPKGVPGKTCAVHWYNAWNGELWKTDIVPYGASLTTPPDPCIAGYEFAGWDGDWTNVTEDRAIAACYYINHRVKFVDDITGDTIDEFTIRDGESAWADAPEHKNKKFDHYQKDDGGRYDGEGIHRDITFYAIYVDD